MIADFTFMKRTAPIIGDRDSDEGATHGLRGELNLESELAAAVRADHSADRRRTEAIQVGFSAWRGAVRA